MSNVTVIIPTWNRADTIEKAVRSALDQIIPPFEILVCDDGSTDGTEQIIKSIGDERVKWIPSPHSGRPALPRNRGIRESKGEWLAFLDSDDAWLPDKLEKQLNLAKKMGCRAVCSNAHRLVPEKGRQGELLSWKQERITFNDLLDVNLVICSSSLIHNSIFEQALGFPEAPCLTAIEDYSLWLRVATQTDFAYVKKPLLIYRDAPNNSIRNPDATTVWMQRKFVLSNFLDWSEKRKISNEYMAKARKAYKKASRCATKYRWFNCLKKIIPQ